MKSIANGIKNAFMGIALAGLAGCCATVENPCSPEGGRITKKEISERLKTTGNVCGIKNPTMQTREGKKLILD